MNVKVGTFNLNNLFSRYNFKGEISAINADSTSVDSDLEYRFDENGYYKIRTYEGRLVRGKDTLGTRAVADRIKAIGAHVLAVQEVEDIDTLREFNRDWLDGMYGFVALIEGNDPRLIDLGVLSMLPLGGVTSWKHVPHPSRPNETVFSRDLQEVEVYNANRSKRLFTLYNNHLKSHFVAANEDTPANHAANNARRTLQAETIAQIVKNRMRPDSPFIITGDMNDPPASACLAKIAANADLNMVDALANAQETRPAKPDNPPPASPIWTHRFKPANQPAQYELFDHVWISPALAPKLTAAFIDRRTKHSGDGSDHDPAWIELNL